MSWYKNDRSNWKEIIQSHFYESDYNNVTRKLLYEDVSYDEAVAKGIAVIADMDIFQYKEHLSRVYDSVDEMWADLNS